jgi:nitrite reductase/ring-hydroxylating ferredoxin subunit
MNGTTAARFVRALRLEEIAEEGCQVVALEGRNIALFRHQGGVYAVDNRCPHMGFPFSKGSVQCGILTCHWHHAQFDLASGGAFDVWADDVRAYPVRVQEGEVWIDLAPSPAETLERQRARLQEGILQNLRLIIAKAVIALQSAGVSDRLALEAGAVCGTRYNRSGWGAGLTIMTAMGNMLPWLFPEERPRALYHGLTHVSNQIAGAAADIPQTPLPRMEGDPDTLKRWFREFIEVRKQDGAERVLLTAIHSGLPMPAVADMIFSAATDHIYTGGGHTLDFCNKAFELLDLIGWEHAQTVLPSLIPALTGGQRSEELSNWRRPIDIAQLLQEVYRELPQITARGARSGQTWCGRRELTETILQGEPSGILRALTAALEAGASFEEAASAVAYAAALRIAHFRTSNEFGDWITVLHTFTYANAVHQAMRRAPSTELLRGVFDGAMSVYLDRFLNMPPAPLPRPQAGKVAPLETLLTMMNSQQQVNPVAQYIADYLASGEPDGDLLGMLGQALLREDADFHTYQMAEAGFRQYQALRGTEEGRNVLIAVGRYLAAHAPTDRAMGQTYQIAMRLHRGEEIYAE